MIVMKTNTKLTANYFGDTCCRPQCIGSTVCLRTAAQQLFEAFELRIRQSVRPLRIWPRGQRLRSLSCRLSPSIERRAIHAKKTRNYRGPFALLY
jgi:hypothetical protein